MLKNISARSWNLPREIPHSSNRYRGSPMKTLFVLLISLFSVTACQSSLTRSVAINAKPPTIPVSLLQECRQAAVIPKGANARQIAGVIAHDRFALAECRRDKSALNKAVKTALD
ncbi:MAG: hypothetical protein GY798_31575 [Hyphomicrobiales bacterium]|nr:hypothetical protein [Hyphomicrobiales bacterium]